ncbi:MAG: hypothetical protein GX590_08075 [Lentisphaerae bacterium]|nr:hypothetical protein [Lentisphaerota bacterium]
MSSIAESIAQLVVFGVFFVLYVANLPAAQTNWNSKAKAHANPVIARAIERRTMAPAKPRVASQRIEHGTVISVLQDGTVVSEPLKRATTARIPEAMGRVRIDAALTRIVAASKGTGDDNDKVARKMEQLADKLERDKGNGNGNGRLAGILGGAAAAAGAAYLAGRKGRTA